MSVQHGLELTAADQGGREASPSTARTLAQSIIERAQYGERHPERLCEGALQAVSSAVQRDSLPVQPE